MNGRISKPSIICDIIGLPQASYNNIFISTFPSIKTPEEYKNTLNPRLKKLLDNSNEGDNPILALYTLK